MATKRWDDDLNGLLVGVFSKPLSIALSHCFSNSPQGKSYLALVWGFLSVTWIFEWMGGGGAEGSAMVGNGTDRFLILFHH